ncbi:hypothetical protein E4U27_001086 [Claviceps purpurea]|nr:hypothetical protein E4U27_001086 [Claviceps purpurea]
MCGNGPKVWASGLGGLCLQRVEATDARLGQLKKEQEGARDPHFPIRPLSDRMLPSASALPSRLLDSAMHKVSNPKQPQLPSLKPHTFDRASVHASFAFASGPRQQTIWAEAMLASSAVHLASATI